MKQVDLTLDSSCDFDRWPEQTERIVTNLINNKSKDVGWSLTIIAVDDEYITKLHDEFLQDRSVTDVITFDLSEGETETEAEIYINHQQAERQAAHYQVLPDQEVLRLIIHGVLHLLGYEDGDPDAQKRMRAEENHWLDGIG